MKRFTVMLTGALLAGGAHLTPSFADEPQTAAPAEVPRISPADLSARLERKDSSLVVLDVRTAAEFAAGHVPGARNVSHDQLAARLAELEPERDREVVVYCRSGRRSALAEDVLRRAGFTKLLHLDGDYLAWEAQQLRVEREPAAAAQ